MQQIYLLKVKEVSTHNIFSKCFHNNETHPHHVRKGKAVEINNLTHIQLPNGNGSASPIINIKFTIYDPEMSETIILKILWGDDIIDQYVIHYMEADHNYTHIFNTRQKRYLLKIIALNSVGLYSERVKTVIIDNFNDNSNGMVSNYPNIAFVQFLLQSRPSNGIINSMGTQTYLFQVADKNDSKYVSLGVVKHENMNIQHTNLTISFNYTQLTAMRFIRVTCRTFNHYVHQSAFASILQIKFIIYPNIVIDNVPFNIITENNETYCSRRGNTFEDDQQLMIIQLLPLYGPIITDNKTIPYRDEFNYEIMPGQFISQTIATPQELCIDQRCCLPKDINISNITIDCTSLTLIECVENDTFCQWDCDYEPTSDRNLSLFDKKFINFTQFTAGTYSAPIIYNTTENTTTIPETINTVEDFIESTKMWQVSYQCGVIYEYKFKMWKAIELFNKLYNNSNDTRRRLTDVNIIPLAANDDRVEVKKDVCGTKLVFRGLTTAGRDEKTGKEKNFQCSGTFISCRVLLTAAHCIYSWKKKDFYHKKGIGATWAHYINGKQVKDLLGIAASLRKSWVDPNYSKSKTLLESFNYDIALIVLIGPFMKANIGYYGIGYDERAGSNPSLNNPLQLYHLGYPGDKKDKTLWYEPCFQHKKDKFKFISATCDLSTGHSGGPVYYFQDVDGVPAPGGYKIPTTDGVKTDVGIIYAVAAGMGIKDKVNYFTRITKTRFNQVNYIVIDIIQKL